MDIILVPAVDALADDPDADNITADDAALLQGPVDDLRIIQIFPDFELIDSYHAYIVSYHRVKLSRAGGNMLQYAGRR